MKSTFAPKRQPGGLPHPQLLGNQHPTNMTSVELYYLDDPAKCGSGRCLESQSAINGDIIFHVFQCQFSNHITSERTWEI